ncbi:MULTISPECIES: ABC transporter substrate-binding protein [unclassified Mesorhizobium]|uniref:ABC transporter substrate-binding protein n=1 Tax=unclassified Mesorhizobium TaxID=325217 RepID=UPI0016754619|nr:MULTISPECIES: ABC transporter substrate-binding protein [unclassified Mesorhizobium]
MQSKIEFTKSSMYAGISRRAFLATSGFAVASFALSGKSVAATQKGGTLKGAITAPATALDPFAVSEPGGFVIVGQTGEYLAVAQADGTLKPVLAESWEPRENGKVWVYKIRSGVSFHDGTPMTAKDVAATFNRHADPDVGSNALSALKGILSKGGAVTKDDTTVEFTLDAPYGNFPYTASSDNYNCVILKNGDSTDYPNNQNGTGPWKLKEMRPGRGVTYIKNEKYWGSAPSFDEVVWTFYEDMGAAILAVQSGAADVLSGFDTRAGAALFKNPKVNVVSLPSSAHEVIHMRTDISPFNDSRIRKAVALSIDRPAVVKVLFDNKAEVGNDSPFAHVFPSTDKSVPQRVKDVPAAKALLAEAGVADGFKVDLLTQKSASIPELAVLVQDQLREIGITVNIVQMGTDQYYGDLKFGTSPFLDSAFGIDDYSHRSVPNVFLSAQLSSTGVWNAAHFKNAKYDDLMSKYFVATDLETQQKVAGEIERLLLEETPQLGLYFKNSNMVHSLGVTGVQANAMGQLFLGEAALVE